MDRQSLQEQYAPHHICFGCGPSNPKGLRIRSFFQDGVYVADWEPQEHHQAFEGMMSGGIVGTLLDCHMNWASAHHLMTRAGLSHPPCTVTAEFTVKLHRPTPTNGSVHISARVVESSEDRTVVESILEANGETCATGHGRFVAVKPGHPAYRRW